MADNNLPVSETAVVPQHDDPQEQRRIVDVRFDEATKATVKTTVFPGCTDQEMLIFLYKCVTVGCHPLSGKIIPVKFTDNSETGGGNKRLSFISTIDLFRSQANESGEYDGQDEPEFSEDIIEIEQDRGDPVEAPAECRVRVYRKGITRPFVGVARWKEYYPGLKRGHMWRKMPNTMLAKCAEANAFRKAFPERLNLVYAAEELDQAGDRLDTSSKPTVAPTKALPRAATVTTGGSTATAGVSTPSAAPLQTPTLEERKAKGYISEAQERRLIAISTKAGVSVPDLKRFILASKGYHHLWQISWKNDEYTKLCKKLEEDPKGVLAKAATAPTAAPVAQATPQEPDVSVSFVQVATELAARGGMDKAALDAAVYANWGYESVDCLPAEHESAVIDWLQDNIDNKGK